MSNLLDLQPALSLVLAETQGANVTRYVHAPRGIHAQKDSAGNWEWMVNDGLGSIREVVDNNLNVLWSNCFDPIGNGFGAVGTSQTEFGFTGEQTDLVGLVYLRNRYMSPALGQFISMDFLESLNRYVYASANPTNRIDLNGLQDFSVNCQFMIDGTGVPVWVCGGSQGSGSRFGDVFRPTNGISNFGTFTQPGSINWNNVGIGISQNGQKIRGLEQAFCMDPERCAAIQVQLYTPQIQPRDPCDDNPSLCGGVFVPEVIWDFGVTANTRTRPRPIPGPQIGIPEWLLELLRRYGWCLGELLKWLELVRWLDRTIPWEDDDDGCEEGSHKIVWPFPIWTTEGHGDVGATSGDYDYPPKHVTKILSPERDEDIREDYRNADPRNERAYQNLGFTLGKSLARFHHKWPLFLEGPDTIDNIVLLTVPQHDTWHRQLNSQGKTGWMPLDPNGTRYYLDC